MDINQDESVNPLDELLISVEELKQPTPKIQYEYQLAGDDGGGGEWD